MLNSRRGGLLAAVCSAGLICGLTAGPAAAAETLADAIALAYDFNPTLQAQRASQRALDENYVQARSGYRPSLTATAGATYQEVRTPAAARGLTIDTNGDGIADARGAGIQEANSGSAALSLNQPLYRWRPAWPPRCQPPRPKS